MKRYEQRVKSHSLIQASPFQLVVATCSNVAFHLPQKLEIRPGNDITPKCKSIQFSQKLKEKSLATDSRPVNKNTLDCIFRVETATRAQIGVVQCCVYQIRHK